MLGVGSYELTPKEIGKNLSVSLCSNRSPPSFRPDSLSFNLIWSAVQAIVMYVSFLNSLVVGLIHNWNHTMISVCCRKYTLFAINLAFRELSVNLLCYILSKCWIIFYYFYCTKIDGNVARLTSLCINKVTTLTEP